jgi:hypothetical protein
MAALDDKLHGKQAAAIAALLAQRTIAEAAQQVGIGERTLLRWLQEDSAFQAAYRTARRHVVQHAVAQVQQATSTAVATLEAIMQDSTASASARVSAAKAVLETAIKGVEVEDLEARMTALESPEPGADGMSLPRLSSRLTKLEAQRRPAVIAAVLRRVRQCAPSEVGAFLAAELTGRDRETVDAIMAQLTEAEGAALDALIDPELFAFIETLPRGRAGGHHQGRPGSPPAVMARLPALEERPRMSLSRLGTRLTRLEHDASRLLWTADFQASCVRLLAAASTEIGLAPRRVQELCTACEQTLSALRPSVPACITDLQAVEAFTDRVVAAMLAMLETHVTNPSTRYRLRKALSQACDREALRRGGHTA